MVNPKRVPILHHVTHQMTSAEMKQVPCSCTSRSSIQSTDQATTKVAIVAYTRDVTGQKRLHCPSLVLQFFEER